MELTNIDSVNQSSLVMQYDDQFPPLPTSNIPNQKKQTAYNAEKPRFQSKNSVVTQTLVVPLTERRFVSRDSNDLTQSSQKKVCQSVAQKCGVSIELNSGNRDQNLTVFITGLLSEVQNAKKILAKELQTQIQVQHKVPKEYHKHILGRNGATLREIESDTSTNITLPRPNDSNEMIVIHGTKDGIDRAKLEIDRIVLERSRTATERITIPRRYYPFINGPNNAKINQIRDMTNVKVIFPPQTSPSEEITVFGEREDVYKTIEILKNIYENVKNTSGFLNIEISKSQHRYIYGTRGSGITEIFEKTGVSIELPRLEENNENITLYGPHDALPAALTLVIQKSESMLAATVEAPDWLHKFIIGKQRCNLNKILEKYEGVNINFKEDSDTISIEGPKAEVLEIKQLLTNHVAELKRTMAIAELQVDPRFHRHIIGRNGTNIQRMKDEYKVQIRMPNALATGKNAQDIKIEGDPDGVVKAKEEIELMKIKLENEKSKDVVVDHKYHSFLIGAQGSKIKELRSQYPDVTIMFPDSGSKSDIVQIRGPKQQVDQAAKMIEKLVQEVIDNNYVKEVKIFKQYHKNIIGKGGINVKKIREETNIRIDIPDEQSDHDMIILTGKKEKVEEAAQKIEAIQSELISIKTDTVEIPHKFHTSFVGSRGKLIKSIQKEYNGIEIIFPPFDSKSDKVTIRGSEDDVEKAKKRLLEFAGKSQLLSYQGSINIKPEFHKFIGRNSGALNDFRKKHSVVLLFPDDDDTNKECVQILGCKEYVLQAKQELEEIVKTLESEIEMKITIDPKWHKHFFKRRQYVMEEISRDYGGVKIFFPKIDATENVDEVRVIGPKGCIEAAIARIESIVENLKLQTSISVFIEQKHHRTLLTTNVSDIKDIQSSYDVMIKFPNRDMVNLRQDSQNNENAINGDNDDNVINEIDETNPINLVTISGRAENCALAKEAVLDLVPVSEEVTLANEFHKNLIRYKSDGMPFSAKYKIILSIPTINTNAEYISMKGPKKNIEEAKAGLLELIDLWEKEKQDKIAQSFELEVDVPVVFHRNLIGQKGANITMFRSKFNVNIQMPVQNSGSSTVLIRGYEEDALKAKEEICSMVKKLEAQIVEELHIPKEVHPLLIGTRGFNLKKLKEQFKVEIVFPSKNLADSERANFVEVVGDKENVDKCCDYLIEKANELLDEFEERNVGQNKNISSQNVLLKSNENNKKFMSKSEASNLSPGFIVTGAPWQHKNQQVPDSSSNEDFPRMDAHGDNCNNPSTGAATSCLVNGHFI